MTPLLCCLLLPLRGADPDAALLRDLASPDAAVRLRAVAEVERRGADAPDAAYLAALAPLLREADLPTRGLAALAIDRHIAACRDAVPDGVVAALLDRLGDDDRHVVGLCRRALVRLGPVALPDVGRWLRGPGPTTADRLRALEVCRAVGRAEAGRAGAEAVYWDALADADAAVAGRAGDLLDDLPAGTFRDLGRIRAVLASRNERGRGRAVEKLLALGEAAFADALVLLDRPEPDAPAAARLLGVLLATADPIPAETHALLAATADLAGRDWIDFRRVLARIDHLQADPPPAVVAAIDRALAGRAGLDLVEADRVARAHGEQAVRVLEDRLLTAAPPARDLAATLLARLTPTVRTSARTLEALAVATSSDRDATATEAAKALSQALGRPPWGGSSRPVPPPVLAALAAGLRDDAVRKSCIAGLTACGRRAEGTLCDLLRDPTPQVQEGAALAIAQMATVYRVVPERTLPHLARLKESPDAKVARLATDVHTLLVRLQKEAKP